MFFSLKTAAEETETNRETVRDTDKTMTENEKAAAESDTETEKENRQTVTAAATEAAVVIMTEINTETKRTADSEFKKNIRLLAAIQMMLRVLFIF